MAFLAPYLLGVVTAPLAAKVFKPMLRGIVKATAGVALEAKRAATEASVERPAKTSGGRDLRAHDETAHEASVGRPAKASGGRDLRAHDETAHEATVTVHEVNVEKSAKGQRGEGSP